MAYYDPKNDNDGYNSNSDAYTDEWYELSPEALEKIAGGVGEYGDYDTYRYWRDQNGVMREIR